MFCALFALLSFTDFHPRPTQPRPYSVLREPPPCTVPQKNAPPCASQVEREVVAELTILFYHHNSVTSALSLLTRLTWSWSWSSLKSLHQDLHHWIMLIWDSLLSMLCRLSTLCLLVMLSTPATFASMSSSTASSSSLSYSWWCYWWWSSPCCQLCCSWSRWSSCIWITLFFFCEQSFGILKTQRLWKLSPQYSHFSPCLNIPNSISPQKL